MYMCSNEMGKKYNFCIKHTLQYWTRLLPLLEENGLIHERKHALLSGFRK